ncbi:GTPase IMAP family member 5-like [Protobothrops mucrosquamatus]|uniref:GTPase IMAP family member 5-like n=1 Tax=Protobothrops mucrosquamatus TaxID=103944 RepID=UPI0010FB9958|nr:GTPase IMAP family member 5-like [Protobothrops mucrosquamatus]
MSYKPITKVYQKEDTQLNGRKVVVVDTPDFFDFSCPQKDIAAEVRNCVKLCSPGPHVILHVIRPGRFSREEEVAQLIKEIFGLQAKRYIILLFTRKEELEGTSLKNFISVHYGNKEYVAGCGNRCLAFNNKAEGAEREAQVAELMTMIDRLVETNGDAPYYTEEMMKFNKRHKFWFFSPFPTRPESLFN